MNCLHRQHASLILANYQTDARCTRTVDISTWGAIWSHFSVVQWNKIFTKSMLITVMAGDLLQFSSISFISPRSDRVIGILCFFAGYHLILKWGGILAVNISSDPFFALYLKNFFLNFQWLLKVLMIFKCFL